MQMVVQESCTYLNFSKSDHVSVLQIMPLFVVHGDHALFGLGDVGDDTGTRRLPVGVVHCELVTKITEHISTK